MSRFIESIQIKDGKVFLLDLHQKRVNQTFLHFGRPQMLNLTELFLALPCLEKGLYKWRIAYDLQGNVQSQILPYTLPNLKNFALVVNDEISYPYKNEDRTLLNEIKTQCPAQEAIIVKNGTVTDTTFSNLIFLKKQTWFTPASFLLNGVQRQHLLNTNKIKEEEITLDNINEFSHFQIINSMNGLNPSSIYPLEAIMNLPGFRQQIV
ncbi:aminotransferase class IV [Bergeyella sp. RCAD1439]|uniref:aminotransferase class IV n=1 Tax=Bergeyella anatis TaxID=3113737 RepID=UPI002E170C64|nr:aminotransferase class IV [Bergeyella sp. RCAD1439]